jgi:serine/threonine protein kinase
MRLLVLLAALAAAPSPVEPVEQSVAVESYSGSILLPDVRSTLEKLLAQPFEFFDLTIPATTAGLLDVRSSELTADIRQWLYNHIVATSTDSTENGGGSAQTMIYVGLEDGRFVGYYGPEGVRAYTFRAASGEAEDLGLAPFASLTEVNDCAASGECGSPSGKIVAASCPAEPRLPASSSCTSTACLDGGGVPDLSATDDATCATLGGAHSWTVGTCCTATCCDGDIRGYFSTSLDAVGAPTAFASWKTYDHRARPWYREAKEAWEANSSHVVSWSNIYEFSTNQAIGITVMGAAVHNSEFLGVYAIDFELGGLSGQLNISVHRQRGNTERSAFAYIVERQSGKLLGTTTGDTLYDNSLATSFAEQRLSATASRHPSIATSAELLAADEWPERYLSHHQQQGQGQRWELQSKIYTGPKHRLDWMIVVGQDIHCAPGEVWLSLAGRCETCRAGTQPDPTGSECWDCSPGYASSLGVCVQCTDGHMPTQDRSSCVQCPDGTAGTGGSCDRCNSFFSEPSEEYDSCNFLGSQAASLMFTLAVVAVAGLLAWRARQHHKRQSIYLKRYRPDHGPSIHCSRTAEALFAMDMLQARRRVCIKKMANEQQFRAEINGRFLADGTILDPGAVIEVLTWHTPKGLHVTSHDGAKHEEPEHTDPDDHYPFVLVMELGERSLHDACAKERIAGIQLDVVRHAARSIATCLQVLHTQGVCHADIKQRNVIRLGDGWILCDLDAATPFGQPINVEKTSSAYCPPELACWKFANGSPVLAAPSYDIWSFGVLLFELCSGQTLFSQDISNDELINAADQTKLCTWFCAQENESALVPSEKALKRLESWRSARAYHHRVISDEELEPVLSDPGVDLGLDLGRRLTGYACMGAAGQGHHDTARAIKDARNLIRWCLMGPVSERPTVDQVLSHRFLAPDTVEPEPRPVRYHAFMSHAQADASGTANTLFFSYAKLGLTNWIDMRQQDLTLQGMRNGVKDSDVFLVILSERLLSSWYCQQELLCAIEHNKPIQIVLEVESRFHPFDLAVWEAGKASGERHIAVANQSGEIEQRRVCVSKDDRNAWQAAKTEEELTTILCAAVDENMPNAVAYRRRDFEQEAMLRELCRRNGVVLPIPAYSRQHHQQTSGSGSELEQEQQQQKLSPVGAASPPTVATPKLEGLGNLTRTMSRQKVASDWGRNTRVFVICSDATGGRLLRDIQAGFEEATSAGRVTLSSDPTHSADKFLLLLTDGVLTEPECVRQLERVLGGERGGENLSIIYDEKSWEFGCAAQQAASDVVKGCLETHEALTYRPRDPDGWLRHEFPAMIEKLLLNLGVLSLAVATDDAGGSTTQVSASTKDGTCPQRSTTPPPRAQAADEVILELPKRRP